MSDGTAPFAVNRARSGFFRPFIDPIAAFLREATAPNGNEALRQSAREPAGLRNLVRRQDPAARPCPLTGDPRRIIPCPPNASRKTSSSSSGPDSRSEQVTLDATGKSGGAGEIFSIDSKPGFVAKIYHAATSQAHLAQYRRKIQWMVDNKPALPQVPAEYQDVVQLAWPEALILRQSRFVGFAMRKIAFDRTLELDYLLNRRQAAQEGFDADYGKLVTVSFNLASIIHCLHDKRIAIVDLKPMNVKVYKAELYVSILDCDGFHIATDEFRSDAPQVTPEYLAPEFQDKAVAYPEAQDRFALATIIFRLLNYGIHPFTGVASDHHNYPPELAGRIKQGLYPYGKVAHKSVRKVPASVHEAFPDSLRELFDRAFASSGYIEAERPRMGRCPGDLREQAQRADVDCATRGICDSPADPARPACAMR